MSRRHHLWRSVGFAVATIAVLVVVWLAWPAGSPRAVASLPASPELIERGRYLTAAADCVACHTLPGGAPYAGGRAFKLPFGTIHAPNITPDRATGIGDWNDAEFVRALHEGVGRRGEELYPALPYTSYAQMTTADALAIKAYLFSLPPIRNEVVANRLAFPFDQRRLIRFWKVLFVRKGEFVPEPERDTDWNRGAYLATALGHCGECHTPRNLLYGTSGPALSGETTQGWTAWNITSDAVHGIGAWSLDELVDYLRVGYAAERGVASGPMKEAVDYSLSHLSAADLRSLAVYLKGTKAAARGPAAETAAVATADSSATTAAGRRLFEGACQSCHALDGQGSQAPGATLRNRRSVTDPHGVNLVQSVLHGGVALGQYGAEHMPAFAHAYTDAEIAATANFVVRHFGGVNARIAEADVAKLRAD